MREGQASRRCPYCQADMGPAQAIITCPQCGVSHHKECWDANSGCATVSCMAPAVTPRYPSAGGDRIPVGMPNRYRAYTYRRSHLVLAIGTTVLVMTNVLDR